MSALTLGVPRAFKSHKGPVGWAYGAFGRAYAKRCGGRVPDEARDLLKARGRIVASIEWTHAELETARRRRRLRDARRLSRQLAGLNRDLLSYTARLDEIAQRHAPSPLSELLGSRRG